MFPPLGIRYFYLSQGRLIGLRYLDAHQHKLSRTSGIGGDHSPGFHLASFAFFALLYDRRASVVVPVGHLAFQAVVAFVVDNFAGGFDRSDLALVSA